MSTPSGRAKVRDIVVEILQAEPSFNSPSQTDQPSPSLSISPLSREPTALFPLKQAEDVSVRVDTTAPGDAREAGGGVSGTAAVAPADEKIIPSGGIDGEAAPLKKKRKVSHSTMQPHCIWTWLAAGKSRD